MPPFKSFPECIKDKRKTIFNGFFSIQILILMLALVLSLSDLSVLTIKIIYSFEFAVTRFVGSKFLYLLYIEKFLRKQISNILFYTAKTVAFLKSSSLQLAAVKP